MCRIAEDPGTAGRHGVVFEAIPDAFDRIGLRRVGGRDFPGVRARLRFDAQADRLAVMGLEGDPDDRQLSADRGVKHFEELDELRRADRAAMGRT